MDQVATPFVLVEETAANTVGAKKATAPTGGSRGAAAARSVLLSNGGEGPLAAAAQPGDNKDEQAPDQQLPTGLGADGHRPTPHPFVEQGVADG